MLSDYEKRRILREAAARKAAKERGGEILTRDHISSGDPVTVKCSCGYVWETKIYSLTTSWCPQCAENAPVTLPELRQLVEYRGGKIINPPGELKNKKERLRFQCKKGHNWETGARQIWEGHWCSVCAKNAKGTIEEMQEIAELRGGQCLSKEYINSKTKLKWICDAGHTWWAPPSTIKGSKNRKGAWCRQCAINSFRSRKGFCAIWQRKGF